MKGFCTKILQNIHIWEQKEQLFSHCMITWMSVDIEFWNNPSACLQNILPVPVLFVSCHLSCIWCEICLHLPSFSMLIWAPSVPLKSALNQSMRYLERTASDLPVSPPNQVNLKSSQTSKLNPLFLHIFPHSRTKFWLLLKPSKLPNISSPTMQHT